MVHLYLEVSRFPVLVLSRYNTPDKKIKPNSITPFVLIFHNLSVASSSGARHLFRPTMNLRQSYLFTSNHEEDSCSSRRISFFDPPANPLQLTLRLLFLPRASSPITARLSHQLLKRSQCAPCISIDVDKPSCLRPHVPLALRDVRCLTEPFL